MSDKRAGARLVDRRSTRRVPSREGQAQKAPQATFSNGLVSGRIYVQAPEMDILLVEDSPEVSLITVEYLQELGHQAVAVVDAELALEQVAQRTFDAVMTDVSLPGMSGIELAKELAKKYPKLPVVISSGYGSLNVEFLMGSAQSNVMVLPKPYDLDMLEKTLNEAASITRSEAGRHSLATRLYTATRYIPPTGPKPRRSGPELLGRSIFVARV